MTEFGTNQSNTRGEGALFWLLIALGLTGLTPCVLLPEWRQYEALSVAEQVEAHRLSELQSVVDHKRAAYEALRSDPAVVARLAQRELGYVRPDERSVSVARLVHDRSFVDNAVHASEADVDIGSSFAVEPVAPHPFVARVTGALPDMNYDADFCDDRERSIIMTMSLALIVLAAVLFARSPMRSAALEPDSDRIS